MTKEVIQKLLALQRVELDKIMTAEIWTKEGNVVSVNNVIWDALEAGYQLGLEQL